MVIRSGYTCFHPIRPEQSRAVSVGLIGSGRCQLARVYISSVVVLFSRCQSDVVEMLQVCVTLMTSRWLLL